MFQKMKWSPCVILLFLTSIVLGGEPSCRASSKCQEKVLSEASKAADSYRQCLLGELKSKQIWKQLQPAIKTCLTRDKYWESLEVRRVGKLTPANISKPVVLPPKNSPCVVVLARHGTFKFEEGSAEKKLLQIMPQCKFHVAAGGIDGKARSKVKFYKKTLAETERGDPETKGSDPSEEMIKLKTLLENYVKQPHIDYLWIDGKMLTVVQDRDAQKVPPETCFHEYSILTDPTDVTVCQVHLVTAMFAEIDGFDILKSARPRFKGLITSIISNSSFLPIRSVFSKEGGELRTFYIDVSNPFCLKKYLVPKFCDDKEECDGDDSKDVKHNDDEEDDDEDDDGGHGKDQATGTTKASKQAEDEEDDEEEDDGGTKAQARAATKAAQQNKEDGDDDGANAKKSDGVKGSKNNDQAKRDEKQDGKIKGGKRDKDDEDEDEDDDDDDDDDDKDDDE